MDKILVTRPSLPSLDEYVDEIKEMWNTRWLTNMGPKHKMLQAELEKYLGVSHIDLLTNGHMALELSIQALNLKGEVITTPFTFASTTHAIVRNGLTPVFCDIDPDDFTIDVKKIEGLITDKTCAIVPVHVYGNVCNTEGIQGLADKYGLKIIYDAAHTFGVRYQNRGIGDFGDVSCFSFHATKVFNSIEGGAVCYRDEQFGRSLYNLKNFGIRDAETVEAVGVNAKMNEFCAAMGLCNLRHVEEEIEKRRLLVERYRSHLEHVDGIRFNPVQKDVKPNYAYFPVIFDEKVFGAGRDEVFNALEKNGIGARKYFYPLTSSYECYQNMYDSASTPVALYVSEHVLTMPLYADLSMDDVDRICGVILKCRK